jgi:integrase
MTTPNPSRHVRANGAGTVYQRKDGRWEAAGYVLAPGDTRKRVRVYGIIRKEALMKLTEKVAASIGRGCKYPRPSVNCAREASFRTSTRRRARRAVGRVLG